MSLYPKSNDILRDDGELTTKQQTNQTHQNNPPDREHASSDIAVSAAKHTNN